MLFDEDIFIKWRGSNTFLTTNGWRRDGTFFWDKANGSSRNGSAVIISGSESELGGCHLGTWKRAKGGLDFQDGKIKRQVDKVQLQEIRFHTSANELNSGPLGRLKRLQFVWRAFGIRYIITILLGKHFLANAKAKQGAHWSRLWYQDWWWATGSLLAQHDQLQAVESWRPTGHDMLLQIEMYKEIIGKKQLPCDWGSDL